MVPPQERFLRFVSPEPNSGCWLWVGCCDAQGYGRFIIWKDGKAKGYLAHRYWYQFINGPVIPDLSLDHLCRVRSCVNPAHLEAVTQKENVRRGDTGLHQRIKTHCPHGHEYSGTNTYFRLGGRGRGCKTCRSQANAVHRLLRQSMQ